MPAMTEQEVLGNLPAHILLDMARNEAAPYAMRKAAVKLLIEHGYPQAQHHDLVLIRMEIEKERNAEQEVQAIVEAQIEGPLEAPQMKASVTTATLMQEGDMRYNRLRNEDPVDP